MQGTRMVPLTTVPSEFAARVLVAKLGSAGIVAEVRGVSRVYPALFGEPQVWVEAEELADARELITADLDDEMPVDPFDQAAVRTPPASRAVRPVLVVVALALLATIALEVRSCSPHTVVNPAGTTRR